MGRGQEGNRTMQPITIENGWRKATISRWVQSCGSVRFVVVNQHQTRRMFKTLSGAERYARKVTQ
jgi:hypothetical protein